MAYLMRISNYDSEMNRQLNKCDILMRASLFGIMRKERLYIFCRTLECSSHYAA